MIKELRAKAEVATPGPWRSDSCGDVWSINSKIPLVEECGVKLFRVFGSTPTGPDNGTAEFIAAANPKTVIELCDALEKARDALEFLLDAKMTIDENTVPKKGIDTATDQVVFNWHCSYTRILKARSALKELNTILGEP